MADTLQERDIKRLRRRITILEQNRQEDAAKIDALEHAVWRLTEGAEPVRITFTNDEDMKRLLELKYNEGAPGDPQNDGRAWIVKRRELEELRALMETYGIMFLQIAA